MNLIILGPPGSGKGTQGKILAKKFGLFYFEAGDFSRDLAKKDARIRNIVERGKLIPEEEMTKYVNNFLEKKAPQVKNTLYDGYPRFISQYKNLKNWLAEKGAKVDKAIFLNLRDETVIKRLSSRRTCQRCDLPYNLITNPPRRPNTCDICGGKLIVRNDDTTSAIKERLNEYKKNVQPLIDYLQKEGILLKINGEQPIEQIAQNILAKLKKEGGHA